MSAAACQIWPGASGPPGSVWIDGEPEFLGKLQGPLGVLAADRPIVRIGLDPGRMPIGLPRIGHGVHHEAVDVRDRQPCAVEAIADRLPPLRATSPTGQACGTSASSSMPR